VNEVSVSQQLARRDRHFLHAGNNPERANAAQAPAPLGQIYGLTPFLLKFPESFEKQPVCLTGLGAGMWGALRPVEQLQTIFGYRNAYLFPERVFLPKINDLLDDAGRLKDPELLQRLKAQAEGFVEFVECLQKTKLRE
jgi:hypothetical protein